MLRLLHTADVHLGARHTDLGDRAATQRERQFAAFVATVDLALAEKVDLVLIAGDLFDSNVQPRRSVERAAAQLKRLVDARIRIVIAPGTHDLYDRASIYRAYDLAAMSGAVGSDLVTVLDPDHREVHLKALDLIVHGRCWATKRAPESPLSGVDVADDDRAAWHIGLLHASIAIEGKTDGDEVVITTDEIAASHLDYLALGHWHSTSKGKAGGVTYAYAGAPEPVALDQDRAGNVLLVQLDAHDGKKQVTIEERKVGKVRVERLRLDAAKVGSQPALVSKLGDRADANVVLDVDLIGIRPDDLDLHVDEIEQELADRFLKVRVRDRSVAPLPEGSLASPDTVLGAFIRDLEARIAEEEAAADGTDGIDRSEPEMAAAVEDENGTDASTGKKGKRPIPVAGDGPADELRDALRLGRLLLSGVEVTL
ncbi:MAG TPA: DNA repair exonuclease [Candidatus Limnocylindrales bacterium]|nr:DNA repair exonuclease [Candidatus Limnocylindrales bacterium]